MGSLLSQKQKPKHADNLQNFVNSQSCIPMQLYKVTRETTLSLARHTAFLTQHVTIGHIRLYRETVAKNPLVLFEKSTL